MTDTRVEWNGLDLRILRGYGVVAAHYEIWAARSRAQQALAHDLRTGRSESGGLRVARGLSHRRGNSRLRRRYRRARSCRRRPRRRARCTSTKAATWARRSWSASVRAATCTGICGQLELDGPVPAAGTELMHERRTGRDDHQCGRTVMAGGRRIFALGMMRSEAETRNEPLTYADSDAAAGTARILTAAA